MGVKAVIFDLDGTLVVHKLRIREAKAKLLKRMKELGMDVERFSLETPTARILERMRGREREKLLRLIDEVFEPYELEAAEKAEAREGVKEVLEELKGMGLRLAVATNNGRMGVERSLEKVSLKGFFEAIVTRSEAGDMKPRGRILEEALKALRLGRDEAVYVGDTSHDIEAAREAGIKCIVVAGGAHSIERLLSFNPDYFVEDLRQIPSIIRKLAEEA